MDTRFKAFARSQVANRVHRALFAKRTKVADAIEFLETNTKYRAFFSYVKKLAEKTANRLGPSWTPAEFYTAFSIAIQKLEDSSCLQIKFVNPKVLKKNWAFIWPGRRGRPIRIVQGIPKYRRRKDYVLMNALELSALGHEFGHLLIWMGNGEQSVNQSLAHIKCLNDLVTLQHAHRHTRRSDQVEILCEAVSFILLEVAIRHMVWRKPFYTEIPCQKPRNRKRPSKGRLLFVCCIMGILEIKLLNMDNNQHQGSKLTPKFFFLSLGVLVSLIATVTSFLNLVFQTLDKKFPDALNSVYEYGYNTYSFEAARAALATLIIVFPAYLILSYFWRKVVKNKLSHVDEIVRKWMLYLILFLSSIVVIVDLVTLVRYFVSGEITDRFIYKVLITLFVALFVGVYYIFDLQGKNKILGVNINMSAPIKATIIVVALIVWSFSVIGSPSEQRAWRLDERRIQDLQSIQWQVISFWQQKESLPNGIKDLSNPISGFSVPVDPEFEKGLMYEYKKTADMTFELCATFTAVMPQGWQEGYGGVRPMFGGGYAEDSVSSYPYPGGGMNESWDHEAGRTCFTRTIDPDIYPPYDNGPKPL